MVGSDGDTNQVERNPFVSGKYIQSVLIGVILREHRPDHGNASAAPGVFAIRAGPV